MGEGAPGGGSGWHDPPTEGTKSTPPPLSKSWRWFAIASRAFFATRTWMRVVRTTRSASWSSQSFSCVVFERTRI